MGKLFACFGGGFKCNRKVESFEKTHAFLASVPGMGPKNSLDLKVFEALFSFLTNFRFTTLK